MKFFPRCDPAGPGRRGRPTRLPFALAALLALLTVAGGAHSLENAGAQLPPGSGAHGRAMLEPGAAAPGFTVKDAAGEVFNFEAENAKSPYLLVFFSIFCEPCRREMAILQRLYEKYRDAGWQVAAIALDGEPLRHSVSGFARQEGYGFRVLIDELDARDMFKVADPYGVSYMPSTFVIEKGGRIAFSCRGAGKEEEIEKSMQSLAKK